MSAITRVVRQINGWLPRRTIRLRLALLYGGLFFVSGVTLLAITYVLVIRAVSAPPPASPDQSPSGQAQPQPLVHPDDQKLSGERVVQTGDALARQLSEVMHQFLLNSALALAITSVLAIVLGWFVAGRMLRPVRTITATVREISATSLHRRLGLAGARDELKELGDTFDSLLARLDASFQTQRRFVANAPHELRTPLARQRALGQVALSDPNATVESLRGAHERILIAGAQQERLIEALLTLTRGHAGLQVREPFSLGRVVHDVLAAKQSEAEHRGVRLLPSISPAIVTGHGGLAERLVTNLVDNALRYNVPDGWIRVTTDTQAGRATLRVANSGPVIPPDVVDDLFQPFRRLTDSRVANADGLGLGLSIVHAIAEAHDATIAALTNPDGGLDITVTFASASNRTDLTVPQASAQGCG
jgi:signal transduction histidine kinase